MPITRRVRGLASIHTRPVRFSFRSRLAHGGLLLLPEKVDGGVAVTLMMREESWGKDESTVSGRVRARGET